MARSIENEREVRAAREAAERATASGESVTAVVARSQGGEPSAVPTGGAHRFLFLVGDYQATSGEGHYLIADAYIC